MMVSVFVKMRHAMYASSSVEKVRTVLSDGYPIADGALYDTDWIEIAGVKIEDITTVLAVIDEDRA